jgi:hypothetical protein
MKKLLIPFFLFFLSLTSVDAQVYAVAPSKADYAAQKASGVITFRFGADVLPETVLTKAEDFQQHFNTAFDEATYTGTFTMTPNTEMNRLMLGRLLIMCGVEVVEFEGEKLPVFQFSNEQLK